MIQCLAAALLNERRKFRGLRIYGLLTDLSRFHFYSYDPVQNKFYTDDKILVDNNRVPFLSGMIHSMYFTRCESLKAHVFSLVSNKIFGVILNAYIEGLQLTISNNAGKASCGDVSHFAPCYDHNFANVSLQFSPPGSSLEDRLQERQKVESKNEVHLKLAAVPLTDCL